MIERVLEIGSRIATPMGLAGFCAALLLGGVWLVLKKIPKLNREGSIPIVIAIVKSFFWLSVISAVLAVVVYAIPTEKRVNFSDPSTISFSLANVWLTEAMREDFFVKAQNVPKPPLPIEITLTSQRTETLKGGQEMRRLLVDANFQVEPAFTYGAKPGRVITGYCYAYHIRAQTNDPSYIAAKKLADAMGLSGIGITGTHADDIPTNGIRIYVGEVSHDTK